MKDKIKKISGFKILTEDEDLDGDDLFIFKELETGKKYTVIVKEWDEGE